MKWFINWFLKCIIRIPAFPLIGAGSPEAFKKPQPSKSLCLSLMQGESSKASLCFSSSSAFAISRNKGKKNLS